MYRALVQEGRGELGQVTNDKDQGAPAGTLRRGEGRRAASRHGLRITVPHLVSEAELLQEAGGWRARSGAVGTRTLVMEK